MNEKDTSWWDFHSNQPYKLPDHKKPRSSWLNIKEYLTVGATAAVVSPLILWRYMSVKPLVPKPVPTEFIGLSVSPNEQYKGAIIEMVDELGVQELLLRVPTWDIERIDYYVEFARQFPKHRFLINVLQNHDSVARPDEWAKHLRIIFREFSSLTKNFQIGNAINRSKWGCAHSGEYLHLLDIAQRVKQEFDGINLLGSSVIDFEPLVTLRTLVNGHEYHLYACASQLYVNRRGSPYGKQYGFFNLERKIRLIYSILSLANRSGKRLWITETNWPLLNTKPWTPNSGHPRSTVDEKTQAEYLEQYYQIAWNSGFVEKVYWWQLINPGYGLVDHRSGRLRKHPSYYAFKDLFDGIDLPNQRTTRVVTLSDK